MAENPHEPGIQISFSQIFSEVRLLHEAITRIETKLDNVSDLEPRVRELENQQIQNRLPDFEKRLRDLEERRMPHQLLNVMAAVLSAAALIWAGLK